MEKDIIERKAKEAIAEIKSSLEDHVLTDFERLERLNEIIIESEKNPENDYRKRIELEKEIYKIRKSFRYCKEARQLREHGND